MSNVIDGFKKTRDYLICIDSDGCAMDTMNIKHIKCFGPCLIEEWGLEKWQEHVLGRWNDINLYAVTRGMNRFKGLLKILEEVNAACTPIEGMEELERWVEDTPELSNEALMCALEKRESVILRKALHWSQEVNLGIERLKEEEKQPFGGVREALAYAHQFADIAIVSSANRRAVLKEWELHGLLKHTDIVLAQDIGSKEYCIGELVRKGYRRDKVLMTGDAVGDYEAAKLNGVFFYPIFVERESESWQEFRETGVDNLISGNYEGTYQQKKLDGFMENFAQRDKGRKTDG